MHENLNAFVGACIDPPDMCVLWKYCVRGSLNVSCLHALWTWKFFSRMTLLLNNKITAITSIVAASNDKFEHNKSLWTILWISTHQQWRMQSDVTNNTTSLNTFFNQSFVLLVSVWGCGRIPQCHVMRQNRITWSFCASFLVIINRKNTYSI